MGGGVFGGANGVQMADEDGDGVWSVTVELSPDTTGNFAFFNSPAHGGDWGTKENLNGQECGDEANWHDRILPEITDGGTFQVCFEFCDTSCPAYHEVTFIVDTSSDVSGDIYLGGGVIGDAQAHVLTFDTSTGTWSVTVDLAEGTSGNYIFLDNPSHGGDWGTKENLADQECGDVDNYNDRVLPEVTGPETYYICFGTCDASCSTEGNSCGQPVCTNAFHFGWLNWT